MSLRNRNIILGITGGIAAYKSAELTRLLVKAGARVQVVMTRSAEAFITPLTLQALSGREVRTALFDPAHEAAMGHIELARWADVILIAPASANTLARLAHGMADDLLTTLCLASPGQLLVAPAMNQQMWANPATRSNLQTLQQRNIKVLGPESGDQACGDIGPGRMREPRDLLQDLQSLFNTGILAGKRVLITAGPTREPIDPVRYLSNRSSGKMGMALVEAALDAGAEVTLIAGPISLASPEAVKRINVETAEEMHNQTLQQAGSQDIFIATAAVSDYRPTAMEKRKIKKSTPALELKLVRNPDILADVARTFPDIFCVGFAAETHDLPAYARQKLERKGLDMIAANPVHDGLGFDRDDNSLQVFWPGGEQSLPVDSKSRLAVKLIELIAARCQQKGSDHASS
ncbi:MAG TPA: bifunctional phosphopantothenoylcysteine decarboxylase/phosphopantothenate--cysteine ligase CoaBC [Gammaproteobacteria bacterium]|nr:bifunctional phosphopantothenoylcysteine decarboxylase/phosphopantothenate--cysteine ligase CoaBC [Gammaproteobacteria bacterium]